MSKISLPDLRQISMPMLCGAALLLLAWLQPLHVQPWLSWHSESLAFAAGLVLWAGVFLRAARTASGRVHLSPSGLVWLTLTVCTVFQWWIGLIPFYGDALVFVLYFSLAWAATVVGFEAGSDSTSTSSPPVVTDQAIATLAWAILAGGLLSTAIAMIQATGLWSDLDWIVRGASVRRPGANLGQPNQLATVQLMGVASLLYLFAKQKLRGLASWLAYFMLMVGLGLTESRTGLLGAMVLLFFWQWHRLAIFPGMVPWVGIAGLGLLAICFLGSPVFVTLLQEGSLTAGKTPSADLTAGMRLTVWPQLLEAALQRPWLGWGMRQVSVAHNAVLDHYTLAEPFTYAHNLVLDLILGLGFPIALALIAVVALWLVRGLKRVNDLAGWYGLSLVLALGVHSMLEYPFAYAYFLLPAFFGVGVVEARLAPSRRVGVDWKWLALPSLTVMALMAWSVIEYVSVEEDFRIARFEAQHTGKTPDDYRRPNIVMLSQMEAMLEASRLEPVPNMDVQQIALARQAALRFPWTALQNRYALVLALNGNTHEAVRQLKVMRAMHGEKHYQRIRAAWQEMADTKFPQLKAVDLP